MPSSTSSSDNAYPAPKTSFFDPEHVDRPVPLRPWRVIALVAVAATVALMVGWELYWRAHWHLPGDFKNTAALWAQERRKAEGDATVIIGSSRIFFDIDLDVWEEVSGIRPVQLALEGTSPQPVLANLAADETFTGTVVVGITAPLTFSGYAYRGEVIDYVKKESPSQRIGHLLGMQLEKIFAYTDDQTRPKQMIHYTDFPLRKGMKRRMQPHKLSVSKSDRNTEMWARVVEDDDYRQLAKDVWADGIVRRLEGLKDPESPAFDAIAKQTATIIGEIGEDIEKIRMRGGEVVFARMPFEGMYEEIESKAYPREKAWDRLLAETNSVGVHFRDFPELQGYYIAEWSHLSAREGERFTRAFVPILYEQLEQKTVERVARDP